MCCLCFIIFIFILSSLALLNSIPSSHSLFSISILHLYSLPLKHPFPQVRIQKKLKLVEKYIANNIENNAKRRIEFERQGAAVKIGKKMVLISLCIFLYMISLFMIYFDFILIHFDFISIFILFRF